MIATNYIITIEDSRLKNRDYELMANDYLRRNHSTIYETEYFNGVLDIFDIDDYETAQAIESGIKSAFDSSPAKFWSDYED